MSNRVAAILALVIVAFIAADVMLNDAAASVFLARKFLDLIWWVAFWR